MQVAVKPPMAVTNAVSWRSEGIKYKKNEVFLDVVESVNLLVNSNGTVVRSEVVGALKMRTFLSGMPECKLGLNDKVLRLAVMCQLNFACFPSKHRTEVPVVSVSCLKPSLPDVNIQLFVCASCQCSACTGLCDMIQSWFLTIDRCCLRLKDVVARATRL